MPARVCLIVSAYDRPESLKLCLQSLKLQSLTEFEVIVTINSDSDAQAQLNQDVVDALKDKRFRAIRTHVPTPYHAAEIVADQTSADWLCFPSDDDYYVPKFLEIMTRSITDEVDLVYCDCVYDPRLPTHLAPYFEAYSRQSGSKAFCDVRPGTYNHVCVKPEYGWIDKAGFLVRRVVFQWIKFPKKLPNWGSDGEFVREAVARKAKCVKAEGILWIHN
jgi:GT2 family glycosyltransferase